uniref:Glutamate carboxypeptidase 2-like n=1 Tax=Saccoglossus kowalevskii TaxID=10224 RepID=A0ABM0M3B2_SACKO|nr:PREDICTED: glutamate carboxypeptidase 2-like [Saccoglossus kowalevskii]
MATNVSNSFTGEQFEMEPTDNYPKEYQKFINHNYENETITEVTDGDSETDRFFATYYSSRRVCFQILLFIVLFLLGLFVGYFINVIAVERSTTTDCTPEIDDHLKQLEKLQELHSNVIGNISSANIQTTANFLANERDRLPVDDDEDIAKYVALRFNAYGFNSVEIVPYQISLNYPIPGTPNKVDVLSPEGAVWYSASFAYQGEKSEDENEPQPSSSNSTDEDGGVQEEAGDGGNLPMFYAYSATGMVEGELIYAHYGDQEDFEKLEQIGVDLTVTDKIGLIRYGRTRDNEKVRLAEKYGLKGVLFYLDPEDRKISSHDWHASPHGIEDPFTSGYPAKDPEDRKISSRDWHASPHGIEDPFTSGYPAKEEAPWIVRMEVNNKPKIKTLYNVIATMKGNADSTRDRFVMMGSHRGVMDNYNGTAMMLELARNLHSIQDENWYPKRTIKMCSWGVMHGVLGSIEWAEEHRLKLLEKAVVYIDLDMAVQGDYTLHVESTAATSRLITSTAKMLLDPVNFKEGVTMHTNWMVKTKSFENPIQTFGTASDYLVFPHKLGIATININYVPFNNTQVDMYYTAPKYHDVNFLYHKAISQLFARLLLSVADASMLQWDYTYTNQLIKDYLTKLDNKCGDTLAEKNFTLDTVNNAVARLENITKNFNIDVTSNSEIYDETMKLRMVNDLLTHLERSFLVPDTRYYGSDTYRHILYSSKQYDTFPAIAERQGTRHHWNNCEAAIGLIPLIQYTIDTASDMLTPDDNSWWW